MEAFVFKYTDDSPLMVHQIILITLKQYSRTILNFSRFVSMVIAKNDHFVLLNKHENIQNILSFFYQLLACTTYNCGSLTSGQPH